MVLQTHGINTGSIKDVNNLDEFADQKEDQTGSKEQKSQGNLFSKKKENLEDKARILELIVRIFNHLFLVNFLFHIALTRGKQLTNIYS